MRAEVWKVVEKRGSNPRGATSIAITSVPGSPPRRQPVRGRITESKKQKAEGRRRKAEGGRRKADGFSIFYFRLFSIFYFPFLICHFSFFIWDSGQVHLRALKNNK